MKVRARTLAPLGRRATEALLAARAEPDVPRPRTRADCRDGPRPCPWISCSHHLYLDVSPRGSIKLNFPHLQPWEMGESCALDVAERDGARLEDVALAMNLTRERARQIETKALVALTPTLRAVVGDEGRPAPKEDTTMETTPEPTPATATLTEATASFDSTKETLRLAEMRLIVVQREVGEARAAHALARSTVMRILGIADTRRPNGAAAPAAKARTKPGQRRGRGELWAAIVALAQRNSVTAADVAAALGCQPTNAATALRTATVAGALRQVKRGVYTAA